jgi:hypothetical protein
MNHYSRILSTVPLVLIGLVAASTLFLSAPQTALADSPVLIVARWKQVSGQTYCALFPWAASDVDTFTRDSLGHEWAPDYDPKALQAGAVIIRTDGIFFSQNPEGTNLNMGWYCSGTTPFYFHMRQSRMQGYQGGRGATNDRGTCDPPPGGTCNRPDDRVTETGGQATLWQGGLPFIQFASTDQAETNTLAQGGESYDQILRDSRFYSSPTLTCQLKLSDNPVACSAALPINQNYAFTKSLTNGTAPYYQYGYQPPFSDYVPPSGVHDFSTTALGVSRQAENYWGFWSIDKAGGDDHQPPAPGTYLCGRVRGSKGEYLMNFNGSQQNTIRISGLADRLGPAVWVNVYVDGFYQFYTAWYQNDNNRYQINHPIGPLPPPYNYSGTHAVAIEFAADCYWPWNPNYPNGKSGTCPSPSYPYPTSAEQGYCPTANGDPDCDRNMYLDNFLITYP